MAMTDEERARIQRRCDPPNELPPLDEQIPDELPPVFEWEPQAPTEQEQDEFFKKYGVKIRQRKTPFAV